MRKNPAVVCMTWDDYMDFKTNSGESLDEYDDGYDEEGFITSKIVPIKMSQMGAVMVEDLFDFHVCMTNFSMTENTVNELNSLDGVESILPLSKYKLRISVGELFDENQVINDVRRTILDVYAKSRKLPAN